MVKPDVKHNYYADLNLATTASVDDVRKAYRKLALQYHPDRNAGREDECVPRFQAIQAANEVLSDATTKAKYDADRRKAGLHPAPTFKPNVPSPGNPYAARSDYPPPPRRTQPGAWPHRASTAGTAGPTPSGADRFTHFPRPPGAAAPRKDAAADRTQQFRAWQNMNNPQPERPRYAPQPPPREPPPQPPPPPRQTRPPPNVPNRPRVNRQDTKMPTEEQIRAGMRYGKATSPAVDEADAASRQSAWSAFQNANVGRTGMPKRGGGPTTPKRPGGFDPNEPGSDERPATGHYVHRHKSADFTERGFPPPPPGPPPNAPSSPLSPNAGRPVADPLRPFRTRNSNTDDAPYSEANRMSTPYSSVSGEKTAFNSDGLRRSASVRDSTKLSPQSDGSSHSRARSVDPATRQKQAEAEAAKASAATKTGPTFNVDHSDSDSSTDPSGTSGPEPNDETQHSPEELNEWPPQQPREPNDRPKKNPMPPSARFLNGTRRPGARDGNVTDSEKPSMQQKAAPNIFSFLVDDGTFNPTRAKSRSAETINTNFSPQPFTGNFQGSGDYFSLNPNGRRQSPSLRSASKHANTTNSMPTSKASSPMPLRPKSFVPEPENVGSRPNATFATPVDGKFDPGHWQEALKDPSTWVVPPPPPNPPLSKAPSRKGSRPSSKASQVGATPTLGTEKSPHVIDDHDHVVDVDQNGNPVASAASVDDGDAMDIDTPERPSETAEPAVPLSASAQEPRLYSVPPSQWRQEQAQSSGHHRHPSGSSRRAQRQSGEGDLKTNLDSIRHTVPLESEKNGLEEFADLSFSLPYASKGSSTLPTQLDEPPAVELPKYPKAPTPPPRLSKASWSEYAQKFSGYLLRHHVWNRSMLEHFNRREPLAAASMSCGPDWLSASGDTVRGAPGFGEYYKAVKHDQKWRAAWQVGCDKHLQNVDDFEHMRNRVKQLAQNGILANA